MQRASRVAALCAFGLASLVSLDPAMAQSADTAEEGEGPAISNPLADMTAQEQFLALHGAVVAYEHCSGESFGDEDAMAINARIREVVGESFGAGHTLDLIYQANVAMDGTLTTQGCGSDAITGAVALFESEIATAVMPTEDAAQ